MRKTLVAELRKTWVLQKRNRAILREMTFANDCANYCFFFAQNWCAKKEKFCVSFRKNCAKVLRMETLLLGGNPSLHWNKYLELWVMVYHGWNGNIYITTARNSLNQLSNLGSHTQLARFEYVLTKYGTTLQYNFSFPNRLFINNQFCYFL